MGFNPDYMRRKILKHYTKIIVGIGFLAIIVLILFSLNYSPIKIEPTPLPSLTPSSTFPLITPLPSSPFTTSSTISPTPSSAASINPSPSSSPNISPSSSPNPLPTSSFSNPPIQSIPIIPTASPIPLYPGEVREYNGTLLSSIGVFRENAISGTQYIDQATYSLRIDGLVKKPLVLNYTQIISNYPLYQKVVTIYCVEGWQATILWEGILMKDLIAQAEPELNAEVVIFHASDGYTTAMPVKYLIDNDIILANKMNNLPLPPERGFPFQLVAESKYGYKWIKWVTEIEFSDNTDYLGYWESRGFSNNADIP